MVIVLDATGARWSRSSPLSWALANESSPLTGPAGSAMRGFCASPSVGLWSALIGVAVASIIDSKVDWSGGEQPKSGGQPASRARASRDRSRVSVLRVHNEDEAGGDSHRDEQPDHDKIYTVQGKQGRDACVQWLPLSAWGSANEAALKRAKEKPTITPQRRERCIHFTPTDSGGARGSTDTHGGPFPVTLVKS
jgi:hypothetical protein